MTGIQEADSLEEEPVAFALDVWEKRKSGQGLQLEVPLQVVVVTRNLHGSSKIQFDLDDYHVQKGPHDVDTENIKMSVFSYQKDDDKDYDGKGRGGRVRGRRRGKSRGRGRGGFHGLCHFFYSQHALLC